MNLNYLGGVWSCFLWVLSGKGRLVWVLVKSGLHRGGRGSPGPAFPWAEQNASGIRGLHFVSGSSILSPLSSGLLAGFVCWDSWLPTASGLPGTVDQRMGSPALFLPQLPWRATTSADLWEHILHPSPAFTALLVPYHGKVPRDNGAGYPPSSGVFLECGGLPGPSLLKQQNVICVTSIKAPLLSLGLSFPNCRVVPGAGSAPTGPDLRIPLGMEKPGDWGGPRALILFRSSPVILLCSQGNEALAWVTPQVSRAPIIPVSLYLLTLKPFPSTTTTPNLCPVSSHSCPLSLQLSPAPAPLQSCVHPTPLTPACWPLSPWAPRDKFYLPHHTVQQQ